MAPIRTGESLSPPINSDGQVPACQKCKVRKRKCDRAKPSCSHCARTNAECVYEIPTQDFQQRLLITALTEENDQQRKRIAELEASLRHATTLQQQSQQRSPVASTHKQTSSPVIVKHPTPPPQSVSFNGYFAERMVAQLLNAQVGWSTSNQSLVATVAQQIGLPVRDVVNQPSYPYSIHVSQFPTTEALPPRALAELMIDRYIEFVNVMQPLLDPETIHADLDAIYPSSSGASILDLQIEPDIRVFRMFMIMGIGYNLLPCAVTDQHCDPKALRRWATSHLAAALRADELTCVVGVCLYCVFAMTDSGSTDPYQTIRIAAALAIEMGLHVERPDLPHEQREMRKRVFWSIYSMDRCISLTLTRPLAIPEDIVAVSFPDAVPDQRCIDYMTSLDIVRQVVFLHRLQGLIVRDVYLSPPTDEDPEDVSSRVRNEIDNWYDNLPLASNNRPHPYLEANYHLLLVRLYCPSPLIRHTPPSSMSTLRNSAYRLMEMYGSTDPAMYRIQRNHITLAHLAFACVALVYTLIETESTPANLKLVSWRRKALEQLDSAESLLAGFSFQSVHAMANLRAFAKLTSDAKKRIGEVPPAPPAQTWSGGSVGGAGANGHGAHSAGSGPSTGPTHAGTGGYSESNGHIGGSGSGSGSGSGTVPTLSTQHPLPPHLSASQTPSNPPVTPHPAPPPLVDNSTFANLFVDGFGMGMTPGGPLGWDNWPAMSHSPWGGMGGTAGTGAVSGASGAGTPGAGLTDIERFLVDFGVGGAAAGMGFAQTHLNGQANANGGMMGGSNEPGGA